MKRDSMYRSLESDGQTGNRLAKPPPEEPDALVAHVRVCEGPGRQRPGLLGKTQIQTRIGLAVGLTLALLAGLAPRAEAAMSATGGDKTYDFGGYRIHTYTTVGTSTFQVAMGGMVQVLVVGGGGGGGCFGGGGGAGGLLTNYAFTAEGGSNYTVVVGDGGGGGSSNGRGTNGQDSVFDTLRAYGGGGGGARDGGTPGRSGLNGGSGGGASPADGAPYGTGGLATNDQGKAGGLGGQSGWGGGGGGGAGQLGSNAVGNVAGRGGDGLVLGTSGSNVWYAGGGGGCTYNGGLGTVGDGGAGGGGKGGKGANGNSATNSTGGGGGGGDTGYIGGKGGSGIVIVKYDKGAPVIENRPATNVSLTAACLNGYLVRTGDSPATVSVYWGGTNGGTTAANWANTNTFAQGQWVTGDNPTTNLALTPSGNWYYNFFVQNGSTSAWSQTLPQYLITGEVTVQASDPTGRTNASDTAMFTVYRPASCTNEGLTVNYTLSGTATNVTDYTVPSTNTVTMSAGQTSTNIVVTPVFKESLAQTVVLTLAPGAYVIGAPNSATCTLATAATANRYWVAAAPGNWNNVNNWSFLTGQPGGYSVPGSGGIAFFDNGGSGNCTMDTAVNVAGIVLTNGPRASS